VFLGNYLEKCSVSTDLNPGHVEELDSAMSNGEEIKLSIQSWRNSDAWQPAFQACLADPGG